MIYPQRPVDVPPPGAGPWWVMGEDQYGETWVMLGPIGSWPEAFNDFEHLFEAADPEWCIWLWTTDDFIRNHVSVIPARVV